MLWQNIRCWLVGWKLWLDGGNDLIGWKVICFGFRTGVFFFLAKLEGLLLGFVFYFY